MQSIVIFLIASASLATAQSMPAGSDPWKAVGFLEGTWDAKTQSGAAGANATGTYTFKKELGGRIMARHSSADGCKGPADFDVERLGKLEAYSPSPSFRPAIRA
jgi:hypothetical protein